MLYIQFYKHNTFAVQQQRYQTVNTDKIYIIMLTKRFNLENNYSEYV